MRAIDTKCEVQVRKEGGRESNLGTLYQVGPPEMNIQKVLVLYAIMCINELEANDFKDLLTTPLSMNRKKKPPLMT